MYYLKQLRSDNSTKLVVVSTKAAGKGYIIEELGDIYLDVDGVRSIEFDFEVYLEWRKRGCQVDKSLKELFKKHGFRS